MEEQVTVIMLGNGRHVKIEDNGKDTIYIYNEDRVALTEIKLEAPPKHTFTYDKWQSSFSDWVGRCESIMKGEEPKDTKAFGYCEHYHNKLPIKECPLSNDICNGCSTESHPEKPWIKYYQATTPQDKVKYAFKIVKAIWERGKETFGVPALAGVYDKSYDPLYKAVNTFLTADPCPDCHSCGKKLECEKWEPGCLISKYICENEECPAYMFRAMFCCGLDYYKSRSGNYVKSYEKNYGKRRKWVFNCKQYKGGEK